jgi:hypothetical protein
MFLFLDFPSVDDPKTEFALIIHRLFVFIQTKKLIHSIIGRWMNKIFSCQYLKIPSY